jgi:hypothetical protein
MAGKIKRKKDGRAGVRPYQPKVRLEAERLFLAGSGVVEIARALRVRSRSTVHRWAQDGGWERKRADVQARASQVQVRRTVGDLAGRNERFRTFFQTVATSAFADLFEREPDGRLKMGADGNPIMRRHRSALDAVRAVVLAHSQIRLIDGEATDRHELIAPLAEIVRSMPPEAREALAGRYIAELDSAEERP